jgi:hypothetical protein
LNSIKKLLDEVGIRVLRDKSKHLTAYAEAHLEKLAKECHQNGNLKKFA